MLSFSSLDHTVTPRNKSVCINTSIEVKIKMWECEYAQLHIVFEGLLTLCATLCLSSATVCFVFLQLHIPYW
jgi:hypothetical protein